ncbi:MAG: GNAT family N-acetyltransferase [Pseudomonadota bacterium]
MLSDGYHDVPLGKVASVVTHLEMKSPASLRGARLPVGLAFERYAPSVDDYRDLFRRIGRNWLWFGRLTLPDKELSAILSNEGTHLYALSENGRSEGLLELDFRTEQQCELAYFGVTHALIGRGAGAYLMDRAIELAWDRDITRFHVHTCTLDSPKALDFYIRSGFRPYKRQIEVADDPRRIGFYDEGAAPHVPLL